MFKKGLIYFQVIFSLFFFISCQKENDFGDRDYKTLGTAAHELLSADIYTSLIVQISYMPGYAPNATTINNLSAFLNTYLNKPVGIQIILQQIPASSKTSLNLQEIVQLERNSRSVFTGGNIIAVHFLITDGYYSTASTFATSYWNTSSCIFGKTIHDNSNGAGQVSSTQLMSVILEHEFGHLLGLVDQGSPMQATHKDVINKGAHCDNSNCLMYYGVETNASGMMGFPKLDANCIADLRANGGK
ncbi:MAG: hypothetical protein ABIN01_20040 [Ferruginibacter sp.]